VSFASFGKLERMWASSSEFGRVWINSCGIWGLEASLNELAWGWAGFGESG